MKVRKERGRAQCSKNREIAKENNIMIRRVELLPVGAWGKKGTFPGVECLGH